MSDSTEKRVLVIARRDPLEAIRVAAGVTVYGHTVSLVFAHGVIELNEAMEAQAELLELAEIEPLSLFDDPEVDKIAESD